MGCPPRTDGILNETTAEYEVLLGMGRPAQEEGRMADKRAWEMHSEQSEGGGEAYLRMLMRLEMP